MPCLLAARMTAVVYLGAGNSEDKLSQAGWAQYVARIRWHINAFIGMSRLRRGQPDGSAAELLGEWFSAPNVAYQNACWAIAVPDDVEREQLHTFKDALAACAGNHHQDSISWAWAPYTLFLGPNGVPHAGTDTA